MIVSRGGWSLKIHIMNQTRFGYRSLCGMIIRERAVREGTLEEITCKRCKEMHERR